MSPLSAAVRRAALLCVPFAAILVTGVTLSSRVCAKTLAPGWNALPRPGVTNPQPGGDYDWGDHDGKPLSGDLTLTPYSGPVFDYPNAFYGGGGAGNGNRPMESTNSYAGTGGPSGNVDARAHFTLSGTSTYYWQWVPPNDASGQPDLTNFPTPPLFVMGKGYSVLSSTLVTSPNAAGLTVSGSVSSGIGSNPPLTISSCPDYQTRTDYAVLTPTQYSATVDTLELSPSVTYDATGVFGQYESWAGGESQNWTGVKDDLYPITLAAPNPLTNPQLGDGTNQFVYDSSQPNGQLTVPASVYVANASTPDTTWLLPHVGLYVSPAMQTGAQPFTWMAADAGLYVNTTGTRPGYTTGWPSGDFCYIGLPPDNTYFGNHAIAMRVDSRTSEIANYQLFYTATASNWPGSDTTTPNWYFYYNLVYPSPGIYKSGAASEYDPASNQIYIGDNGHGPWNMRVFDLDAQNHVHYSGVLYIGGIHSFIYCCGHEAGHQHDVSAGFEVSSSTSAHPDNDLGNGTGDGLDDNWETRNGFNPRNPDTTGAYNNEPQNSADYNKGDRECVCDIQALTALLAPTSTGLVKDLWKKDWANDGLEVGAWNQKVNWPWYFLLGNSASAQSADPPTDAISSLSKLPGNGI